MPVHLSLALSKWRANIRPMVAWQPNGFGELIFRDMPIFRRLPIFRLALTNAFSKKLEKHAYAVALHFMYCIFVRIHQTLRVTPAMEAGISNHVWSIGELISLLGYGHIMFVGSHGRGIVGHHYPEKHEPIDDDGVWELTDQTLIRSEDFTDDT
jgi:hypothetical protein